MRIKSSSVDVPGTDNRSVLFVDDFRVFPLLRIRSPHSFLDFWAPRSKAAVSHSDLLQARYLATVSTLFVASPDKYLPNYHSRPALLGLKPVAVRFRAEI